jgi:hypothetical protein
VIWIKQTTKIYLKYDKNCKYGMMRCLRDEKQLKSHLEKHAKKHGLRKHQKKEWITEETWTKTKRREQRK